MRHFIIITITLLLVPTAFATSKSHLHEVAAREADSLYRADDYQAAAEAYEAVLAAGFASADLYYNLGNAYYRLDETGRAILNYERALRLKPSMSDAKENLALANARTTDRITTLPQLFIVRWWNSLTIVVTPSGWRIIWLVLLAIVATGIVLLRSGRTSTLRKAGLATTAVSLLSLLLTTALLISATRSYNAHPYAIIVDQTVTLKASPDNKSIDKMILHEGTKVKVLDDLTGWYKVSIADGTTGWCQQNTIERI